MPLRSILCVLGGLFLCGCVTTRTSIPPPSQAWLRVYFRYPFYGAKADFHGRVGPGFELHRESSRPDLALAVILPNGREPYIRFLQDDAYRRFVSDWERIGILKYTKNVLEGGGMPQNAVEIDLPPYDDYTFVISMSVDGVGRSIEVYAPDHFAAKLTGRPEGTALRECLDLVRRTVGQLSL